MVKWNAEQYSQILNHIENIITGQRVWKTFPSMCNSYKYWRLFILAIGHHQHFMKNSKVSKFALYSHRNKHCLGIFMKLELCWNVCFWGKKNVKLWFLGRALSSSVSPCRDHKIDGRVQSTPCSAWGQQSFSLQHQNEFLHHSSSLLINNRWMMKATGFPCLLHHCPQQKTFSFWCSSKMFLMALITTSHNIRAGEVKPPRRKWCLARPLTARSWIFGWYYLNSRSCREPQPWQAWPWTTQP